ncbi:MAG TPA: hypothetical protein VMJ10_16020 [Kofleriaceae bacterium]|nr:hypothetical protein [Kofleriaceae bacterium]
MAKISRRLLSHLTALVIAGASGETASAATDACADESADLDVDIAASQLGRTVAITLGEMTPLAATHFATTWALSGEPLRRAAIAHSLEWAFPLFGDDAILDHLSRDVSPEVRAAVARAAWIRRRSSADLGVLERLADDPDPEVRAIATRAL